MSIRRVLSILAIVSVVACAGIIVPAAAARQTSKSTTSKQKAAAKSPGKRSKASAKTKGAKAKGKTASRKERAAVARRLRRINRAFVASTDLKPMARQLLQNRTRAAYTGVESYARRHAGSDAGDMAYLVLGYAHVLDRDYAEAIPPLKKAHARVDELSDYTDYFLGSAYAGTSQPEQTIAILKDFETRHGDSLFLRDAMVTYAAALVAANRPQEAIAALDKYRQPERP
ncbi:MAG TPA: hypothetical protein VFM10_08120, partial [Terriglobales bacterium]|nr:hypothetical protein [Terriglobales bacterium]